MGAAWVIFSYNSGTSFKVDTMRHISPDFSTDQFKLDDYVGKTPLVRLQRLASHTQATVLAKLEGNNPAGSVKDRPAYNMIMQAEKRGEIKPGDTLIEATSGNTGIALAMVAAMRGYKMKLIMPDNMSQERKDAMRAYGAELIEVTKQQGMEGARDLALEMQQNGQGFVLNQFGNPDNVEAHYLTTGPEIWNDTDGQVDIFVAGVGTGGTVSGVGAYLKSKNPNIKIIAVEPADSPVISGGNPGPHKIQGIGAGFIPKNYDGSVVDEVLQVSNDQAILTARELAQQEGMLVGISCGAAAYAATQVALRPENKGKNIVALLPDTGERYLSTLLYAFEEYPL